VKDVKRLVADIDNRLVRMIQRMNLQSFREVVDEIGPSTDPEYRKFTEILKGCEGWLLQDDASDSHEEFRQKLPGMFSTIPNGVKENEQMRYDMTEHCVDIAIPAMRRGAMLPPTPRERTNTGTPRSTRGGGSVPNVCTPQSSNPYTAQTHGLVDWAPHPSYMGSPNPTYMGSSNPVMPTRGAAPTDQQTSYKLHVCCAALYAYRAVYVPTIREQFKLWTDRWEGHAGCASSFSPGLSLRCGEGVAGCGLSHNPCTIRA